MAQRTTPEVQIFDSIPFYVSDLDSRDPRIPRDRRSGAGGKKFGSSNGSALWRQLRGRGGRTLLSISSSRVIRETRVPPPFPASLRAASKLTAIYHPRQNGAAKPWAARTMRPSWIYSDATLSRMQLLATSAVKGLFHTDPPRFSDSAAKFRCHRR